MNSEIIAFVIAGVLLLIAAALFVPIRRPEAKEKRHADNLVIPVYRDDDRYWYGFFYYNPDDPDVIVPKRYGIGWTVNFGRPAGKLFAIALLILILLPLVMLFVPGFNHATGCHLLSGCTP